MKWVRTQGDVLINLRDVSRIWPKWTGNSDDTVTVWAQVGDAVELLGTYSDNAEAGDALDNLYEWIDSCGQGVFRMPE